MKFEEKLECVLDEIASVYKNSYEFIPVIRENIVNRESYYHDITPTFNKYETTYVKDMKTVGDLFINRLINNVSEFIYSSFYNPNDNELYNPYNRSFKLVKMENSLDYVRSKIANRAVNVSEDNVIRSNKKFINNEYGLILQTAYSGINISETINHNILVNNLCSKYPDVFEIHESDNEDLLMQKGIIPMPIQDKKANIRNYYSAKPNIDILDEILNEEESLIISNITETQGMYKIGKCFKNIENFEFKYYKLSSYARMMRIILGKNLFFEYMYNDAISFYENFDKYKNLCTEILKGNVESKKPVVSCILSSFDKIIESNSMEEVLNLDLFFAKIYEKKLKYLFKKKRVSKKDIPALKDEIMEFKECLLQNDIYPLEHDTVIDNILEYLKNYEKYYYL